MPTPNSRIHLCGRLIAELEGERLEPKLRGRQGRQLFAYLVTNRSRAVSRDELVDALWPYDPPPRPGAALSTLLSLVRRALGAGRIEGRSEIQLMLPAGTWVDIEAAVEAIGRAEAAIERGDWQAASAPGHVVLAIAEREFLPGHDAPWIDVKRRDLEDLFLDALDAVATVGVNVGGSELATAERAARRLIELAPLRESGHVALMDVQAARGTPAEGLQAYEDLRVLLREELGAAPGAAAQQAHARLLEASSEDAVAPEPPAAHPPAPEPAGSGERAPLPPLLAAPSRIDFVGRQRDLARLDLSLQRAQQLPRQLALVAGDPGIGKTRLLARFGSAAHDAGAHVLYGRAAETGVIPYAPFVEALRHHVAHGAGGEAEAAVRLGGSELVDLLPELADAGAESVSAAPPRRGRDPALARFRLFDAFSSLLVEAGRQAPVVLLLDDLHWADEPTLLLLQHVLRAPDQERLLVVASYRDAELHRARALVEMLADVQRDVPVERVHLRGLAREDVASLARASSGADPPAALIQSIHEETEGNPFFVLELSRHLAEAGAVAASATGTTASLAERVGLPEGVRDVIMRRLANLSEPTQKVLRLGSVLGREFDLEVVERIGGMSGDDVVAAVEEGCRARVVSEVPGRPDRYSFGHALINATLYRELGAARRIRLHEQVARTLEELAETGRRVPSAEIAAHLMSALPRGDANRAVKYAERAAFEAAELFAYEDAVSHLSRALAALDEHFTGDSERRAVLLLALGHAQRRSGRMPEARERFMEAVEVARALDDPQLLAEAVLGYGGGYFESAFIDETMVALLEEALAAIPEDDSVVRLELLSRLAKALYYSEEDTEALRARLSSEAIAMAERLEDPRAVLIALEGRHFALTSPENLDERLATARRIIELAAEQGDVERDLLGRYFLISDLVEADDMEAVDRELEEYGRLAAQARLPLHLWYHARYTAMRALLEGRLADAAAMSQRAYELGLPVEPRTATMHFGAQMWLLNHLQGGLAELEDAVRGFVAEYPRVAAWRTGLVTVLLAQGRVEDAQEAFAEFTDSGFEAIPRDAIWSATSAIAAEIVAAGLGDADDARRLYEMLSPFADRNAVTGEVIISLGPISLYAGQLALAMGEVDVAVDHLEDALERCARMGALPFEARAAGVLAGALQARGAAGDAKRAGEMAARAEAIVAQLSPPAGEPVAA